MTISSLGRRRFLKIGVSGAVVVVVAGVGAYLALQSQPSPVATPTTAPAAPPTTPTPALAPAPTPSSTLLEKANQEGTVNMYSGTDIETLQAIKAGFEKKYPQIKVEIHRISETERILTEARAKKYIMDTFSYTGEDALELLNEGLGAEYISPEDAAYPPHLKDPKGLWTINAGGPQAIGYNVQLVKGNDIPKSYFDVVQPRFKDKIGVYMPEQQPQLFWAIEQKFVGADKYDSWLKQLAAQNPKMFKGSAIGITMMKQGETEVAVSFFCGSLTDAMKRGDPLDYVREPGSVMANPQLCGVAKFAPHPNAARLLKDYWLSVDGQTVMSELRNRIPMRPGVPSKLGLGIGVGIPIESRDVFMAWPYSREEMQRAVLKAKAALGT